MSDPRALSAQSQLDHLRGKFSALDKAVKILLKGPKAGPQPFIVFVTSFDQLIERATVLADRKYRATHGKGIHPEDPSNLGFPIVVGVRTEARVFKGGSAWSYVYHHSILSGVVDADQRTLWCHAFEIGSEASREDAEQLMRDLVNDHAMTYVEVVADALVSVPNDKIVYGAPPKLTMVRAKS